jgi:hypothetical protein
MPVNVSDRRSITGGSRRAVDGLHQQTWYPIDRFPDPWSGSAGLRRPFSPAGATSAGTEKLRFGGEKRVIGGRNVWEVRYSAGALTHRTTALAAGLVGTRAQCATSVALCHPDVLAR